MRSRINYMKKRGDGRGGWLWFPPDYKTQVERKGRGGGLGFKNRENQSDLVEGFLVVEEKKTSINPNFSEDKWKGLLVCSHGTEER